MCTVTSNVSLQYQLVKMRSIRAVVLVAETDEEILLSHCAFILCVSNKYLIIIRNVIPENILYKGKDVYSHFTSQETRTNIRSTDSQMW
jgi:hypothetical protein